MHLIRLIHGCYEVDSELEEGSIQREEVDRMILESGTSSIAKNNLDAIAEALVGGSTVRIETIASSSIITLDSLSFSATPLLLS
jgi:hypothetical protein